GSEAGASWRANGNNAMMSDPLFGWAVSTAGDVNGDGLADIAVGRPLYTDATLNSRGAVAVYLGQAAVATRATGTLRHSDVVGLGDVAMGNLGFSVSTAGDVSGDGLADVLAWGGGHFRLFAGGGPGPAMLTLWAVDLPPTPSSLSNDPVATGDVNGDGLGDL